MVKDKPELQNKLAEDIFGDSSIGAVFSPAQKVKILNWLIEHGGEAGWKGRRFGNKRRILQFVKSDPELKGVYEANREKFEMRRGRK